VGGTQIRTETLTGKTKTPLRNKYETVHLVLD